MIYQIHIENRGPEGIRSFRDFRATEAKSDELQKRIAEGVPLDELLAGLEATEEELKAPAKS